MAARGRLKFLSLALIALSLLGTSSCRHPPTSAANSVASELKDLQKLDELTTLFNHEHGTPRLVLLLSPT